MTTIKIHCDNSWDADLFRAAYELQRFLWVDDPTAIALVPRDAEAAQKLETLTIALHTAIANYPKTVVDEDQTLSE